MDIAANFHSIRGAAQRKDPTEMAEVTKRLTVGFNKAYVIFEFAVLTGVSLSMAYVFYEFYKPDLPSCYAAQSSFRAYSTPVDNHGDDWMDDSEQDMTPQFK